MAYKQEEGPDDARRVLGLLSGLGPSHVSASGQRSQHTLAGLRCLILNWVLYTATAAQLCSELFPDGQVDIGQQASREGQSQPQQQAEGEFLHRRHGGDMFTLVHSSWNFENTSRETSNVFA